MRQVKENRMAHFDKETYEKKEEWAVSHNKEQSEIAIANGMTEEQAAAMEQLCKDRHYLHTHASDLFISESSDHLTICKMLDTEYESESNIHNYLTKAGLSNNLSFDTISLDDNSTYDVDQDFNDDDEREEARIKALENSADFMEKVNDKIEQFMRAIDEKYGTQYCPTGIARSQI